MKNSLPSKLIITAIAILYVLCFAGPLFARELKVVSPVKDILGVKQEQAREYRESGLEYQRAGNLAEALTFYQKAIAVDPNFAIAYNDLGIVYEEMGLLDRAEESYLKSIKIKPAYASVYTNLALFYENQRKFEKAAFYWNKRVALGAPNDPWTQKAVNRLRDIRISLSGQPFSDSREEDVLSLMKDLAQDKTRLNKIEESPAQKYFKKAKLSFEKGDMPTAIKEALAAEYLDQDNPEIKAFIEKAELRALTR